MKTLVVHYLPCWQHSNLSEFLEAFLDEADGQALEALDLAMDAPELLMTGNLQAYIATNLLGQDLDSHEREAMDRMDRMGRVFSEANALVMAFPVLNGSRPALVRAYLEAVMASGGRSNGRQSSDTGLTEDKRALILMTSPGSYEEATRHMDHAAGLARSELQLMGFRDIRTVAAAGGDQVPERREVAVLAGCREIRRIVREWYPSAATVAA